MRTLLVVLLLLSIPCMAAPKAAPATAGETVERFYRQYLNFKTIGRKPAPRLTYSKGLAALIAKNKKICRQKAPGDVCGFGADGDPFLDAQDFDDQLTFENSGFKLSEPTPGEVAVSFNVYPASNPGGAEPRKIIFKMIREKGRWVVDDIIYSNGAARMQIQQELESFQ